jgi:ATP-binding cassette subfamily B protein
MRFVGIDNPRDEAAAPDENWVAVGLTCRPVGAGGALHSSSRCCSGAWSTCCRDPTRLSSSELWSEAGALLAMWGAVGPVGIGANVAVALLADRMAHRNRLLCWGAISSTCCRCRLSFTGDTQSGG